MPQLSAFTPCGALALSSAPSYVEKFYRQLALLLSANAYTNDQAFDLTPGGYLEAWVYATARGLARHVLMLERAGNQVDPSKCLELLPLLEMDYQLVPGPKDSWLTRQQALAAAMLLPSGGTTQTIIAGLQALLGSDFVAYVPAPSTTVYPSNPGNGPGQFLDVRAPLRFLQLVDPVVQTGSQWCAYEALDTSAVPSRSWTAGATFSVGQNVTPTKQNANGYYFLCVTAGTAGTVEPTWPSQLGATVTDGTVTWRCAATIAPLLKAGDTIVVDAGNTSQMEKLTVTAVSATTQTQCTPGYPCFQASFGKSHDVGAPIVAGNFPYWWSTQRHALVVVGAAAASDPVKRAKVDGYMRKIARGVSTWAVVADEQPTGAATISMALGQSQLGPFAPSAPMGAAPVGTFAFTPGS